MSLVGLIQSFDHFFFDLDGVLWECETLLPGAKSLLSELASLNKSIYYISNNTNHTRQTFSSLFSSLSLPSDSESIICGSYNCSHYLQNNFPQGSKVFVIGSDNLCSEISSAGFSVISTRSMEEVQLTTTQLGQLETEADIKAVIVGYSHKLNFYILSYAVNCLSNGATLITSNYDNCDKAGKYNVPGAGCTVEFLRYAVNGDFINVGKPEKSVIENIIQRDKLNRDKCIIFGDKMKTDILLGKNAGVKTVLMLTGAETQESLANYDFQPDYILRNLLIS